MYWWLDFWVILLSSFEKVVLRGQIFDLVWGNAEDVFFLNKFFGGHDSFLWGHWYPCSGLLVTSHLGFKARVGSLICTWWRGTFYTFPEIHLWCNTCWPLGSWANLFHIPATRHWREGLEQETYRSTSEWSTDWAMPVGRRCLFVKYGKNRYDCALKYQSSKSKN